MLQVNRNDALKICTRLGAQLPSDVSDADLTAHLAELVKVAAHDDLFIEGNDEESERLNTLLDDLIIARGKFEIISQPSQDVSEPECTEVESKCAEVDEKDDVEPVKTKTKAAVKTSKSAKRNISSKSNENDTKSRAYWAGYLIGKYGLDVKISSDLVNELDTITSTVNPQNAKFNLYNAKRYIRGYVDAVKEK